jgi:hypothetical protein
MDATLVPRVFAHIGRSRGWGLLNLCIELLIADLAPLPFMEH